MHCESHFISRVKTAYIFENSLLSFSPTGLPSRLSISGTHRFFLFHLCLVICDYWCETGGVKGGQSRAEGIINCIIY